MDIIDLGMSKERLVNLKIEKMNLGGQGIGYLSGKVCFVDYTIPGEEITAEVVFEKQDYSVARCREIVKESQYRIQPKCPLFGLCGGCQLQHIDYNHQLSLKKDVLLDTLRYIGKINLSNVEIISDTQWHYRNRAQLPLRDQENLKIGYYKKGTHEVIDQRFCFINQEELNKAAQIIRERIKKANVKIYDERSHKGNLRHLILRRGTHTGQILVIFVTKEKSIPEELFKNLFDEIPGLVGIVQNINPFRTNRILGRKNRILSGRGFYEERLWGKIFRINAASFFQVNTPVFGSIIEVMKKEIAGKKLIDLYAGVGSIGICLAGKENEIVAIEENSWAVEDGIFNARINNIHNVKFIQEKVEEVIKELREGDTVILDPPRKGVRRSVIEYLSENRFNKIIYLSCNPSTLARDAQLLISRDYKIDKAFLFDMFPQTYHIESLITFKK